MRALALRLNNPKSSKASTKKCFPFLGDFPFDYQAMLLSSYGRQTDGQRAASGEFVGQQSTGYLKRKVNEFILTIRP